MKYKRRMAVISMAVVMVMSLTILIANMGIKTAAYGAAYESELTGSGSSYSGSCELGGQDALEKIDAYRALALAGQETRRIKVGVIDSGIARHPALVDNLGTGWDFYNNNSNTWEDTYGHGTHVAGIILSVNPNVELIPLQVLIPNNNEYEYDTDAIIAAVRYATREKIPVINLSFHIYYSEALGEVLSEYEGLAICSANNDLVVNLDNQRKDHPYYYPAAYSLEYDNILTVGASTTDPVTSEECRANYSNYGPRAVQLFAPGTDILSTYPEELCDNNIYCDPNAHVERGYHLMTGTSMAAPEVTILRTQKNNINIENDSKNSTK